MKTFLFLFLSIFILMQSNAQQIKFNHSFATGEYPAPETVFSVDSSYFVLGPKRINDRGLLTISKFDINGNYLWEKSYGDTVQSFIDGVENSWIKLKDNQFAATGDINSYSSPYWRSITLYKFDSEFDTLWMKTYLKDTINIFARGVTICSDGGFAIAGFSKRDEATGEILPQYTGKGLLLRTDSMGNYLWHKTYGEWDYGNELYKVVQTPDGGFLCGGATRSYSSNHNWDWYLVKTDSLGVEEWHRTYGSGYDDSRIGGITITRDTNYVITGGKASNIELSRPYIKVLDKNFYNIKTINLPYQSSSSALAKTIELSDGKFVIIGTDRTNTTETNIVNLIKFDEDFNTIWRRQYTAYDTTNVDNYMISVDTCSDGGYVIGGWAAVYDGNGQRLALIKTDSLGCDGTDWWDCSTGVMIKEYANSESFKMYPNPTKNVFFVKLESEYFDRLSNRKIESVAILDLTGKAIKTIHVDGSQNNIRINIEEFKSGIYLVKVGERIEKLIVQ